MAKPSKPKLTTKIPPLPKISSKVPGPQAPAITKPLGAGEGGPNPALIPANSQRGIKSRVPLDVPGVKLR